MYLTRVVPLTSFVISRLVERANGGDAYAQHQLLWQLFPEQSNRKFLFRYEQGRRGPCYYLLSRIQPSGVVEGIEIDSRPFLPKLKVGDRLAYTLRANPTKMLKSDEFGQRGQRVDVLMDAKLRANGKDDVDIAQVQETAARNWLLEPIRQERLGVNFVASPEVSEHQQHQVYKTRGKSNRSKPIQFTSVNYQGVLEVKDPGRFIAQLGQGIGRAKAMGCGLMMIRRCD